MTTNQEQMRDVDTFAPIVGRTTACRAFGLSVRTERHRRRVRSEKQRCETTHTPTTLQCRWCMPLTTRHPTSPSRIPDAQRQEIYDVLCGERFCDLSPEQVYWELLDQGKYYCSVRTMYRILTEHNAHHERRRGRHTQPKSHVMPQLRAVKPNQVWCWDVTLLPTMTKGKWYFAYCIIDLFSRKIVGWMIAQEESQENAEQLIRETCERRGVERASLTIHADRGAIQRADSVQALMATRGITPSYSRPRVSNDNAFIESFFKTLKYRHDYPLCFATSQDARWWIATFITWYNARHHHSGLNGYTPNQVDDGSWIDVYDIRQRALDDAYAAHPERFRSRPIAKVPPGEVTLNVRKQNGGNDGTGVPVANALQGAEEVMPIVA